MPLLGFNLPLPQYNKGMADALLIYNPAAGRISVRPFIAGVIRVLNDHGWRVEVAESVNGRHTTHLARMAAKGLVSRSGRRYALTAIPPQRHLL